MGISKERRGKGGAVRLPASQGEQKKATVEERDEERRESGKKKQKRLDSP